tara:strand:+ start:458 stop:700 length:243 start_codon:yes stop_codon:yes gene_type:complete
MSLIKTHLLQKMTETQDNIIDRDELQKAYIDSILESMDIDALEQLAKDYLNDNYDEYTVDQLITEVEDYYPHLLEESEEK